MLFFNLFRDNLKAIRFFSYICLSNTCPDPSFHNRQSQVFFLCASHILITTLCPRQSTLAVPITTHTMT